MALSEFASIHVADFASLRATFTWRQRLARAETPGLRWVKAMSPIGSPETGGFGAGPPRLRRQLIVAAWASREAYQDSLGVSPLSNEWSTQAWHLELVPYKARGTFRGPVPFAPARAAPEGPIAALTLGRASWRSSGRFAWEGAKLTEEILRAPGVVTAISCGFPPFGNATFSVWEREQEMLAFTYGRDALHRRTIESDRRHRILEEQIGVRFAIDGIRGTWDAATTPGSERLRALAERLTRSGAELVR